VPRARQYTCPEHVFIFPSYFFGIVYKCQYLEKLNLKNITIHTQEV